MNNRVRIAKNGIREIPKHDKERILGRNPRLMEEKKMVVEDSSKVTNSRNGPKRCTSRREKKIALEQDVDKLRKKLRHEENVHRALRRAFTRPLGALPRLPSYLPSYTLELVAEVAVLEEEVVRLEGQVMNFRQGLYQEAFYISSSKSTIQNGFDLRFDRFPSQKTNNSELTKSHCPLIHPSASAISSSSPSIPWSNHNPSSNQFMNGKQVPKKLNFSLAEDYIGKENQSNMHSTKNLEHSTVNNASRIKDSERGNRDRVACEEANGANKLSEEILRCLLQIFTSISLPKDTVAVESEMCPSVSGSCDSSYQDVYFLDPYDICKLLGQRDIGPYKLLREVDSSSSDVNLKSKFSFLTRKLKLLLRKLSSVDISELTHQQKLAFWINIYNSCMMNTFLENGLPTTAEMVFALMPKAKVNVGGHLFSAMTIEHFMLRLPCNSKHISPKGLKCSEVIRSSMFALDWSEPLVTFALSCGSWSSPAVRIYTACEVEKQLEEAKRDYLQAAVGLSKSNRLAIPKLLDWYMSDFAKDIESLMDWICLQLPNEIRSDAVKCVGMGRRGLIPQPVQVLPYDFRFRYLLTP
ncbi:hypothetical protein KFK09_019987 [Dendrobium nobile]|uniref:Transcription factor n=1 Tax=Dendrobium nobile TaxID=94219 RepID=A0A8T3AR27_DENNO|nr:hypothetical protein KFK09_019987 [Dendrobium nobile]